MIEIEQQTRQLKPLIDNLVLIRAAALDDWSGQKEEQDTTRVLCVVSDIQAIEPCLGDRSCRKMERCFLSILPT